MRKVIKPLIYKGLLIEMKLKKNVNVMTLDSEGKLLTLA